MPPEAVGLDVADRAEDRDCLAVERLSPPPRRVVVVVTACSSEQRDRQHVAMVAKRRCDAMNSPQEMSAAGRIRRM
jgi:hypothetical protein